jgi:hypothetical protein
MFFISLKNKANLIRNGLAIPLSPYPSRNNWGLHTEDAFNDMLQREKKRSERSSRPHLLMRMSIANGSRETEKAEIFREIACVLRTCTRRVDTMGWQRCNETLGVIFTEISRDADRNFIEGRILSKITVRLSTTLDQTQLSKLAISFHWSPEINKKQFLYGSPHVRLISDREPLLTFGVRSDREQDGGKGRTASGRYAVKPCDRV